MRDRSWLPRSPKQTSPEVQNRGVSGLQKRLTSSKCEKIKNVCSSVHLQVVLIFVFMYSDELVTFGIVNQLIETVKQFNMTIKNQAERIEKLEGL